MSYLHWNIQSYINQHLEYPTETMDILTILSLERSRSGSFQKTQNAWLDHFSSLQKIDELQFDEFDMFYQLDAKSS